MRAYVHACVSACVRACVHVCVQLHGLQFTNLLQICVNLFHVNYVRDLPLHIVLTCLYGNICNDFKIV